MSAGAAQITLHGYFVRGRKRVFPFHQITGIGSKRRQAGSRMADRADSVCMGQAPCLLLQPLPV